MKKTILFNPKKISLKNGDISTLNIFQKTVDFFENKGLASIREDDKLVKWQDDFMKYQKKHKIYATMLTAEGYGKDARYDLSRICKMSEILAFYSFAYQYPYQVSILGVGPIWMSDNEKQKKELAKQLQEGHIFAFGMSEKDHGADLYSNECTIKPIGKGKYVANGNKYYIGNAQIAPKITTLGKNSETGEWAYWVVDSRHRHYNYVKDILTPAINQARVGEYEMIEYPLTEDDILTVGKEAFANGLSSVNIGKFQLGFASTGIVTHAFYEAITHANRRIIYGKKVTNFPHIRSFLSEAFCRINAMRLYALRSLDYFRSMSETDRRYLLFNPIQKMKVTTQGADVMRLIMDVVCAKGYEIDTYMSDASLTIDYLHRLEGTAHVNMSLVLKFMQNYFFDNIDIAEIPIREDLVDDSNIFKQTMGGLKFVKFADYKKAYKNIESSNVKIFFEQIEIFKNMLSKAKIEESLAKNMDYMLGIGDIFTVIVYAQLVLEGAKLNDIDNELIDQIFALFIKDINKYALAQLNAHNNQEVIEKSLKELIFKSPLKDKEKDELFWKEYVQTQDGVYLMKDSGVSL